VVVVDARKIRLIAESTLKCDRVDAEILARLSRFDSALLQPVYQRSYAAQELRTRLKVRQSLVRSRAKLITTIRGSPLDEGLDEGLLDYCEIIVPFLVYRGMGRKIRHLVEANGLVEITGRCIQRRFLLRPSPKLNAVIRGVLARAQMRHGMRVS
jgi:hypothetical protein